MPETLALPQTAKAPSGATAQILPAVFFTFISYLSVGIPLAVLPLFVHMNLGYGTVLAGLVISAQYVATILSRPNAGRMTDTRGAKRTVVYGMLACALSGAATFAAAFFRTQPPLCLALLFLSRLPVGEGMGSTGAMMWGIGRAGSQHIAKVISWNGVATFTALSIGAPLGVFLNQRWGLATGGLLISAICLAVLILAL